MAEFEPRILAFLCNWCAYASADLAGVSRLQYPPNARGIRIMCSSSVSFENILKAFQLGTDGVFVGGWHPGDCHYEYGNYMAFQRVAVLKDLLEFVRIERERLNLVWVSKDPRPLEWEEKTRLQRFQDWKAEFEKCIKCYGCRNICPMCFCKECSLESEDVVTKGEIPPDFPMFHLLRALHMFGRCVDCGMWEEACPANIPLRVLYKKVNDIIETHFQCKPGIEHTEPSPLHKIVEPPPVF